MQNWETLIAQRTEAHRESYKPQRIEDPVKRNIRNKQRIKDSTPRRKAQHKAWAQSPAGKKSMQERGKRYRATENGKEHCRKKTAIIFFATTTTRHGERTEGNYRERGRNARRPKGKRRTKRHERTAKADDGTRDKAGKLALYAPACGRAHYTAASHVLQVQEEKAHKRTQGSWKRCLQVQGGLWSMTDQLSFLPMLDDAEHPTWLLNGKRGIQNDSGVYVENVLRFREGKLTGVNVEVSLCAEGNYILFEFDYSTGTYGCGHPLCRPCHECHRNNSAEFLAEIIFDTFKNSVVPYDGNLTNYPKETKELIKLCKRLCDRIAKEIK